MKRFLAGLAALAAAAAAPVAAQVQVEVDEPWVRATVAHQQATGAFMRLTAASDARLVGAASPLAGSVEIHEMVLDGAVMKMRPVAAIELPAGQTVELKPGGFHMMLLGLGQPVEAGGRVPLTLVLEGADGQRATVEVDAPVRPLHGHGGHARH